MHFIVRYTIPPIVRPHLQLFFRCPTVMAFRCVKLLSSLKCLLQEGRLLDAFLAIITTQKVDAVQEVLVAQLLRLRGVSPFHFIPPARSHYPVIQYPFHFPFDFSFVGNDWGSILVCQMHVELDRTGVKALQELYALGFRNIGQ